MVRGEREAQTGAEVHRGEACQNDEHGGDRDGVMQRMGDRGVATAPYLPSIHLQSYMRERYGFREGMFPVSENASARTMALPFHARLGEDEQEYVVETLRASL